MALHYKTLQSSALRAERCRRAAHDGSEARRQWKVDAGGAAREQKGGRVELQQLQQLRRRGRRAGGAARAPRAVRHEPAEVGVMRLRAV